MEKNAGKGEQFNPLKEIKKTKRYWTLPKEAIPTT